MMIVGKMKYCSVFVMAISAGLLLTGCNQPATPPPPPKVEEKITPEEAEMRREAREIGTKLYTTARKAEQANLSEENQQQMLKPVYNDLEQFIFNRMSSYSNRITSITITYSRPALQCIIYVKPGDDDEMKGLKRTADSLVGRVIENLPIVKYLMVKNEQ